MYRNKRNNVLLEIQFKRFENNDFIIIVSIKKVVNKKQLRYRRLLAEQAEICLPDTPIHFFPFFAVFLFIIKASGTSKALGIYLYHPHPCMIFLYVIYNDFRRRIASKCLDVILYHPPAANDFTLEFMTSYLMGASPPLDVN